MWNWLRRWLSPDPRCVPLGQRGEQAAARFLQQQGYRILARSHRNRLGEIDLIAREGDRIVFVEVKTRQSSAHGLPVEAVDRQKQQRLTRAGLAWLKQRGWLNRPARFDVIAIIWPDDTSPPVITHYRSAFEATGHGQMYS